MSKDKPEEFFRFLEKGETVPVFLLYGEDFLAMDRAFKAVEERVLEGDLPEFNVDYFHGKEADPGQVVGAARTLPVMADKRLVVVRRVEEWKGLARERLIEYLASPAPATVLVLIAGALALRGAGTRKDDIALVEAAAKAGMAVRFPRPKGARLPRIIQETVRERGKRIESDAVQLLVDLAGDETLGLEQELSKVMIFVGERNQITREDVLEAVADIKEANVFEFTDAIGTRDVESGLRALRRMREQGQEPLMILGMLLRHFRLIWKIQEYMESGQTPGKISKLVGVNEWILKKSYLPQIKKFSESDTGMITRSLADLDIKIKSTRADKDVLFERSVIRLCLGRLF